MSADRHRFAMIDFARNFGHVSPPNDKRNGLRQGKESAARDSQGSRRSGWWPFPGLILVLLATNVTVVTITAIFAATDSSFSIEPDYYQRAVNWDKFAAQREQNHQIGWQATMQASMVGEPVVLRLRDRSGQPISGAHVSMIAFHNAHASNRLSAPLMEIEPGMYRSGETLLRTGAWEVRITATQADQTFTTVLAHDVTAREPRP